MPPLLLPVLVLLLEELEDGGDRFESVVSVVKELPSEMASTEVKGAELPLLLPPPLPPFPLLLLRASLAALAMLTAAAFRIGPRLAMERISSGSMSTWCGVV